MPQLPAHKPVVLAILDGWGHREAIDHNAIAKAKTPHWDALLQAYPHGLLNASELHVGLPTGQMGNSEVGHMNIGSGRVLMQELPRIDAALADGFLAQRPAFTEFVRKVKAATGVCHLLGLLSPGGVHSHQAHMAALAKLLAERGINVYIHAFLDGRDTPPKSALNYVAQLKKDIVGQEAFIRIATLCGRYYAMDRDKRWDRVAKAYAMLIEAQGEHFPSAEACINENYSQRNDEFIHPGIIGDFTGMHDGDGLLMANFRADRAREILEALLDPDFSEFARNRTVQFSATLGMIEYSAKLAPMIPAIFPDEPLTHILSEEIASAGLTQLHIAETEKYAHVTFFFNGGREAPFPGEERILVPSPNVATYDLKPEMSAFEITDQLVQAIDSKRFDFIVVNYANTDMVGHSGNLQAAVKAVETVDSCLGRLVQATLAHGGALLITADHGNAEMMFDEASKQAHTAHTLNLVPAVLVADDFKGKTIAIPEGRLGDVAPTLLQLLHLPQPPEMTGTSLLANYAC